MTQQELETVYEALATAIDAVGQEQSEVFLAKLALALAERIGSTEASLKAIEECTTGLVPPREP